MTTKREKSSYMDGGMNRKDVDSFAYGILYDLGFEDWKIEWSKASPGLCIHETRTILMPLKFLMTQPLWYAFEYVLHEIAHINTYKGYGDGHDNIFFSQYADLIKRYLG